MELANIPARNDVDPDAQLIAEKERGVQRRFLQLSVFNG